MTKEQLQSLDIGIDTENSKAVLMANSAVEWLAENTTIDIEDIENIPYCAKLFISGFCDINGLPIGIASESIEGLSQSYTSGNKADMIWDLANSLLSSYLKCQVRFVTAQSRWL